MEKKKKYIHYCWFGDRKLSRTAKRCMKSWKRFLPDYEIICWNETNVDLNECAFIKEAYRKKKWAFVADYVRAKVMCEYGGIYLDTDMELNKDIQPLLNEESFLGVEDSGAVAVGIWWEPKPGGFLAKELLSFYKKQRHFNSGAIYSCTIPVVVTSILEKNGFRRGVNEVQRLDHNIVIYSREYFYPLSYDYHNNVFTKNTYATHYYDASWASKDEKKTIGLIRKIGPQNAVFAINIGGKIKALFSYYFKVLWRTILLVLYPIRWFLKKVFIKKPDIKNVYNELEKLNKEIVVFVKDGWMGVESSTKSMFGDDVVIEIPDVDIINARSIAKAIVERGKIKQVIFSGFSVGWDLIVQEIKKLEPEINVAVFWHGSNAMHLEEMDWDRFKKVFELLDSGQLNKVAFAKKSMYEQYKKSGYNVYFLPNNVYLESDTIINKRKNEASGDIVKVGIYSSGDRWVKNMYNQLAAASMLKNVEVDVIPLTNRILEFSQILKIGISGETDPISRDDLLSRIAEDDIVLYVSFVECAPILPLECLELGVLCITGDNHHYWEGTPLEKYLVEPKADNPVAIANRIEKSLKHRDHIFKLYRKWKKDYNSYCKGELKKFLEG